MANEIFMPKLGMTMEQGKVAEWKAKEGDWVEKDQVVLVIETEKVTQEIQAEYAGFLMIAADVGETIPCGGSLGMLAETKEELEKLQKDRPVREKRVEEEPRPAAEAVKAGAAPTEARKEGRRVKIAPVAKKMAEEHGIDITRLAGSGPGGRIVKADIEKAIDAGDAGVAPPMETIDGRRVRKSTPLTGIRQVIAQRMPRSLQESAQLSSSLEVDMTEVIKLRKTLLKKENEIGVRISVTDLFSFFVSRALQASPIINASLIDDEIKLWDDINIGVAMFVETGEEDGALVVPVVKNADKKSLTEISKGRKELMEKARSRKITLDDLTGGTFTLSNMGMFGTDWSMGATPILNWPESALLLMGSIADRPVVRDGQIVIRPMTSLSVTFDHRIIDGVPAARFMMKLTDLIKNPHLGLL